MFEITLDNAGDIITGGFLMAEDLNMHFSSVCTRDKVQWIRVRKVEAVSCNPRSSS